MRKDIGAALDRKTREFGAKKGVRIVKDEDNCIGLMLGPRKTTNHACLATLSGVWIVTGTAPQPKSVVQSLERWAERPSWAGETEFQIFVREKDLLNACEANRWTKPRYRRGAVKNSSKNEIAQLLAGLTEE